MFNLHDWVKRGFVSAINAGQSEYWVILTATPYLAKGILTEEDLMDLQNLLDERNKASQPSEEPFEEPIAEGE